MKYNKEKEKAMDETQTCGNCEEEFAVYQSGEVAHASFCPLCGEELIEIEEDVVDEDWDDQGNTEF